MDNADAGSQFDRRRTQKVESILLTTAVILADGLTTTISALPFGVLSVACSVCKRIYVKARRK